MAIFFINFDYQMSTKNRISLYSMCDLISDVMTYCV